MKAPTSLLAREILLDGFGDLCQRLHLMSCNTAGRWLAAGIALMAAVFPFIASAGEIAPVTTELSGDGRSFALESDGFSRWIGGYSAKVVIGGQEYELSSAAGEVVRSTAIIETEMTPQGSASVTARTIRFPEHQVDLLFRLGRVAGVPGILMQAGISNVGKVPVQLVSVTPMATEFSVAGNPADWLITALDDSVQSGTPMTALGEIRETLNVREYGGFYRNDGTGFVFGPVGTPIAFVDARIARNGAGGTSFIYQADMSHVRVDPGEKRWGQQVVLLMEPPQKALARWAEWVGATHGARTNLGALSGWNSWTFLGGQVSGKDLLEVVDATLKSPERLRPSVIQIDGGYEDPTGMKESNERFPEGLAYYAEKISATGARPGLLLEFNFPRSPFLDWNGVANSGGQMVRNGYSYIKLNSQGIMQTPVGNARQTSLEAMREGFAAIRKAVGEKTYLLNNDYNPNRAALGHVDALRTGVESKRDALRPILDDVLRCYHLQGRWGAVDNDAYYLGTDVENISSIHGGWPLVRTWASMVGLSCGAAITSDPWYWESFKPFLRNVETMTPPASEHTEVLDLCTSREFPRLVGHVTREWGDMTVALLWNPGAKERTVSLDFSQAGMAPDRRYAVWSFWDDQFLGVAKGVWTTPSLAPSASQHLRFTDLDRTPDRPVLIGSNLHIYCGAAEIKRVTSLQGGMEIELTDAGARQGDLFVYSRLTPVLKSVTGCKVDQIAYAGENVWRIALTDRQSGAAQRVEMSIQLPVSKQPWFWLLVGVATASILFGAWRYLAGMRLERQHALQQERSRIAQDLHDNIGANLAQIGLLTEQVEQAMDDPDKMRSQLDRIFTVSHATAKQLDAVVWAVDPSNDTLEEFALYVHGYAEDFLGMAGIRCHFTSTAAMPIMHLSSTLRHHLLMVVKEAIHNTVKHAAATLVTIRIGIEGNRIVLEITDDGRSLPPPGEIVPGNGLENMKSRAAEIGGSCEFLKPETGHGTIVRLTLPIKSK